MKKGILLFILILVTITTVSALELPIGLQRLIEHQQALAASITFFAAFLAGAISFTSPCGFVLFPVYFSYAFQEKKKAVVMTSFFSLGLMIGFIIVGLIAGALGNFFNAYKSTFAVIAGIFMIILGVMLFLNKGFSFFTPKLDQEKKSAWSVFMFGIFFAFGWTPCNFAILSGILLLASLSGSVVKAAMMLGFFALGTIVPLLVLSYFSDKFNFASKIQGKPREFTLFKRKIVTNRYNLVGAIFLMAIGVLTITFQGTQFFQIYATSLLPESLDFTDELNRKFLTGFFASQTGNILGIILVGVILGLMLYIAFKALKSHK